MLSLFDTGLGVVRSLGRAGIPVIGVDFNPAMPGFTSRYCQAKLSPNPVHDPEACLEFLMKEGEHLDERAVLMPASDAYVMFMARYQEELCKRFVFTLPSSQVLDGLVNKRHQYELAEQAGIPLPNTFYPESMAEVRQVKNELDYPVFVKPYIGHLWREIYGGYHKGFKIDTPQELEARYEEIFRHGLPAMVQSLILGPDTNLYEVSFYIGQLGDIQAIFTHQKIHQYPPRFGVSSCAASVYYPELVDLGIQLMHGLNYRGISSIEFKRDDRDGQLKLIELNPRFAQQNILAADCGVNFPLIEYMDLTGNPQPPVTEFITGRKWLDLTIDFPSFWEYYRNHETTIWGWLKTWKGVNSFPALALDDLGPYFKKLGYGKKLTKLPRLLLHKSKKASIHQI